MDPIPADFARALSRHQLAGFFTECAYVHRTDYLRWIAESRRPSTRRRKIREAIARLRAQRRELFRAVAAR
ncbi:MAG TPA: YdeI/OmpD-associated family protein [Lacunisphaera sp.]|nr:YdeI/OmpD-associated family protein [Lacunisphaera sp.]